MRLRNVTLEMSLKPFKDTSEATARMVCRDLFRQWWPLIKHADQVSVLLWCADGSEILEYKGDLTEPFEWARYIGGANPRAHVPNDPEGIALHSRPYLYMDNPPEFTYGWLKRLLAIIKEEGRMVTGRPVRVGETFDPGPEFAKSAFKYERHPEICLGETMGAKSFVCSYATLHADAQSYAGFPEGIPEGTPFGVFLGRQAKQFCDDLGFDYLWLSNGFGFGLEPWALRGAVFDGQSFNSARVDEVKRLSLDFWNLFRRECPDLPLETRGTNLSTGMDLASDAVPLRDIYEGGYGMEPPPNSPWAALNHDFGLELVGWMSHIAEIPGETFPFRFYTHDPWWLNSPWLDRYGREPQDIYMPLSVARIDAYGNICNPSSVLLLTADDSYGNLPDQVPNEVIPHILSGLREAPDAAGPLVWVYPFDEYHDRTFSRDPRIDEVFFGDWFMRGAVNSGLPLNTVISTRALPGVIESSPELLGESILVSPVPDAHSAWEDALFTHLGNGGRALLYGPATYASNNLLDLLGIDLAEPLSGEFELNETLSADLLVDDYPKRLTHPGLLSAGGIRETPRKGSGGHHVLLRQDNETRVAVAQPLGPGGTGQLVWLRGTVSCDPAKMRGHLLVPFDPSEHFPAEALARFALRFLGYDLIQDKRSPRQASPMLTIARHANAFFLSGYCPDSTVRQIFRFPAGAPLLLGMQTWLEDGRSTYTLPPSWRRECRVFVEQQAGLVSCREEHSGAIGIKRRMRLSGLESATVRFLPEPGTEAKVTFLRDPQHPYVLGDYIEPELVHDWRGRFLEVPNITGELLISW
ncbi:MAG: hypothetical protein HPY44_14920 [Armatimonadetes bacterium]|nr:hypothetical protein [Armatimonadota bacterium]